jgi:hypothetical protein
MHRSTGSIPCLFTALRGLGNMLGAQTSTVATTCTHSSVRSIAISGSSFVVRGENLSKVNILCSSVGYGNLSGYLRVARNCQPRRASREAPEMGIADLIRAHRDKRY